MKKLAIIFVVVVTAMLTLPKELPNTLATSPSASKHELPTGRLDYRTRKLAHYLNLQRSPLALFAADFVTEADKNNVDYRLLPAISGVESGYARNYIIGSFNAYGWGNGQIYFKSWPDGITKISSSLKTNYIDRGAKTVDQIAPIYNPVTPFAWASKVKAIMGKIEATDATTHQLITNPTLASLVITL